MQSRAATCWNPTPSPARAPARLLGIGLLLATAACAHAQFLWSSGNIGPLGLPGNDVPALGTLEISSASDHDYSTVAWSNHGTVNWTGGRIRGGNASSITNHATWDDSASNVFNNDFGGTVSTFTNAAGAAYHKLAAGTTTMAIPFLNSGTIDVQSGTLLLTSNATFNDGTTQTGAGTLQFQGGVLTAAGTGTFSNFLVTGGTVAGTHTLAGQVEWQAGNFNSGGTTTLAAGAVLRISTGADHDFNTHAFVIEGTVDWTGGRIRSGNAASVAVNGTLNDTASNVMNSDYGGTAWTFSVGAGGEYNKAALGITRFDTVFDVADDGTVNVNAGLLQLNGGGTQSADGKFIAAAGTTVVISNNYTITDASELTGPGSYQISGGTVSLNGAVAAQDLQVNGGNITGTHSFAADAIWNAGTMNAAATTTNDSTWHIIGAADHDYNQRAIVNNGTVNWGGGRLRGGNGSSITNLGMWNDSAASVMNSDYGGAVTTFTNAPGATYHKLGAGTSTIAIPFTSAGAVAIDAGTLLLSSNATFNDQSTQTGAGILQFQGGTLSLNGTNSFAHLLFTGGTITGNHTFDGHLDWQAGNLNSVASSTFDTGSVLSIAGGADHDLNAHAVAINGTVNWTGGRIRGGNGATFTVASTFNDTASNVVNTDYGGTPMVFTVAGTGVYHKDAGGTTRFDTTFNLADGAEVNVNAGVLQVNGGGTQADGGRIVAAPGTSVIFSNTYTINDAFDLTGAGAFVISGGAVTLHGIFGGDVLAINGGNVGGTHVFRSAVTWNAGQMNAAATTTNQADGTWTIATAADHDYNQRALINDGIVHWTGGRIRGGNGSSITNNAVWNDTASSHLNSDYGGTASTFTNATGGTYNKGGAGTTTVLIPFHNAGTVNVDAGGLVLAGSGTLTNGTLAVDAGAGLTISNTMTLSGTVTFAGPGTVEFTGGTLLGSATIQGPLTWNAGNLNQGGTTLTFGPAAQFTIATGADHDFSARALVNQGVVNWNAGRLRSGNGGSFLNAGTFIDGAAYAANNDFGGAVWTFTNAAGATYEKDGLGTTSTIAVPFTNAGALQFDHGTLSLTAGLTLAGTSALNFTLAGTAPDTGYGLLSVSTALALAGSLNLSITGGLESSLTGAETFTLASASSLSGSFINVANGGRLWSADGLGSFQVNYGAGSAFATNSVVLSSFLAVPEPSAWALLLLGLPATSLVLRRRHHPSQCP